MRLVEEQAGTAWLIGEGTTTVGRATDCQVRLRGPAVGALHAEIVRRGDHVRVADGMSANGTFVNGCRVVHERRLADGDVVAFADVRLRVDAPLARADDAVPLPGRPAGLTRREQDVLATLVRPALRAEPFTAPATTEEIAARLFVTEAAVKQHLLRLYGKFGIAPGPGRQARLGNAAVDTGAVRVEFRTEVQERSGG